MQTPIVFQKKYHGKRFRLKTKTKLNIVRVFDSSLSKSLIHKGVSWIQLLHYRLFTKTELTYMTSFRKSHSEVFLRKGVLKICSRFKGEHPCQSGISVKLQRNFIEITCWHGCSPVNLLHISEHFFLGTPLRGCFCSF